MRVRTILEVSAETLGPSAHTTVVERLVKSCAALGVELSRDIDITWSPTDPDGVEPSSTVKRWIVASAEGEFA